jgi:hypothetical protein
LKVLAILSLATLFAPAFGQDAHPAGPGTLNYVEGNASVDGRAVTPQSVGSVTLDAGGTVATANGKVEVLLTPGVFLRMGDDSTVQMISPKLTHTEVQVLRGRVQVEVNQLYPQNNLQIDGSNGQALLLKPGLYELNADNSTLRVFDGKAAAFRGNVSDGDAKAVVVKDGRQLNFAGDVKPQKFDKDTKDELYKWGSLRSQYLGNANESLAEQYAGNYGAGPYYGNGWLWSSGLYGYTWLPGGGAYMSPFGYGFYSPYYLYGGGYYGGGYGRGGYYGGGAFKNYNARNGIGSGAGRSSMSGGGGGSFRGGGGVGARGGGGGGHR